jgi:uncharacterized phage protein (TIGR01671 family)
MSNREIKFRVWSDELKSFLFGKIEDIFLWEGDGGYGFFIMRQDNHTSRLCRGTNLTKEEVEKKQQFTGFIDKNGKDVYEGDLVNVIQRGVTHGPEAEYLKNCEIHFDVETGAWEIGNFHSPGLGYWGGYSFCGDRLDKDTLKVVGNIFETPDLAKEQRIDNINGYLDA